MDTVTKEFARYILLFVLKSWNQTKSNMKKLEYILDNIFKDYSDGKILYKDIEVKPHFLANYDLEYKELNKTAYPLYGVIRGDFEDDMDLENFHKKYDDYYDMIFEHNPELITIQNLSAYVAIYLHFRNNSIYDVSIGDEYCLELDSICISQNRGETEIVHKFIPTYIKDLNYVLIYIKLTPCHLINYAVNDEDFLQDTIHLYTRSYKFFKHFTQEQQDIILKFLEKEKEKNIELFKGKNPVIIKDIVGIINNFSYPEIREDDDEEDVIDCRCSNDQEDENYDDL